MTTVEKQVLRDHALEWIAAGLVAFCVFSAVAFYSFSVDMKTISALSPIAEQNGRT
jgi:hypothetical protein